jgi:hypothetical protein
LESSFDLSFLEPVEYALMIGQPKPVVIAGSVVMALLIGQPEPLEIVGAVVVVARLVEYALVLPPLVVVVMMAGPVEMAESVEYAQMMPPSCCGVGGGEV